MMYADEYNQFQALILQVADEKSLHERNKGLNRGKNSKGLGAMTGLYLVFQRFLRLRSFGADFTYCRCRAPFLIASGTSANPPAMAR